jgi:NAD-dependent SIR2 family protein deacetylase
MDFKDDNYPVREYSDEIAVKIMAALDMLKGEIKKTTCVSCGKELKFDRMDMYDHESGWGVITEIPKQWLSVHCDHCGYDNSLTKLGVNR